MGDSNGQFETCLVYDLAFAADDDNGLMGLQFVFSVDDCFNADDTTSCICCNVYMSLISGTNINLEHQSSWISGTNINLKHNPANLTPMLYQTLILARASEHIFGRPR